MSPLHRRNHGVDKIINESEGIRRDLVTAVEELERFIKLAQAKQAKDRAGKKKPGAGGAPT